MIDTVKLKHFYQTLICEKFRNNFKQTKFGEKPTWVLNAEDKSIPNLTMLQTPNGIWHLSAEVSLPKLLYGHNAKLPNQKEVNKGLELISKYVEIHSELPFDVKSAWVSIVHFAKDFQLTESQVWRMIKKLSEKNLSRMSKDFKSDATIYFKAKNRYIRIYPKLQEVLAKNPTPEAVKVAKGILRIEHCLISNYAINSAIKKYKLSDRTQVNFLNETISNQSISEVLESLDFYDCLTNKKSKLDCLLENFSTKRACDLFGFLQIIKERGGLFYKDKALGYSKDSYYRNIRDCKKAKVW